MDSLAYKPALAESLARLDGLYARQAGDRVFAVMQTPSAALGRFASRYGEAFCQYPDPAERAVFWDRFLAERVAIADDSIPSAYLSEMDQGLYGGLLGGRVQFLSHPENGWISSMVPPLLKDWSELDRLPPPGGDWHQLYLEQLRVFAQAAAGKFGLSHFILINGLNFAFELVGATATYLAADERPETLRRAIDIGFDLNLWVQETFFQRAEMLAGGTCSNMAEWLPGRVVSESVDPFHMTSVAYFETWGREPVERIFARFDGGVIHLHGNGRHLLPAAATLRGLKAIYLGDDRGFPKAFDVLADLQPAARGVPLVLQVPFSRFADALRRGTLCGGVLYKVVDVPSVDAANRLMDLVRAYRR